MTKPLVIQGMTRPIAPDFRLACIRTRPRRLTRNERPALRRVPANSRRPSDLPIRHHEAPAARPRRHLMSDVVHYVNLRTQFCDAFHKM